jgi:hypothetical protein
MEWVWVWVFLFGEMEGNIQVVGDRETSSKQRIAYTWSIDPLYLCPVIKMEHPAGNRRDSHQHVATISISWSFQKASNESMANLLVTPLHAHAYAHAHEQNALCSLVLRPPAETTKQ